MNSNINDYLFSHCISPDRSIHQRDGIFVKNNEIEIQVRDKNNIHIFSKYRVFGKPDMKYRYEKGSSMQLYNSYSLTLDTNEQKTVYITEGEFDCLALYNYLKKEIPVVSSTGGCNSWRDEWTEMLREYECTIVFDTDTAGKKASVELYKKLLGKVKSVSVSKIIGEYNDICEQIYDINRFAIFFIVPTELSLMFGNITTKASLNRTQSYIENNVGDVFYRDKLLEIVSDIYRDKFREKPVLATIDNDIEIVKQIPITHFLDFKGGVCKCIFHSDTNPSLYYNDFNSKYPNTVKCYACGRFADVIDVIMELQRKDFKGAVEYLRGGTNTL